MSGEMDSVGATHNSAASKLADPLGEPWYHERNAYIWTCVVLLISISMTIVFSKIDRHLYDSNNLFLDFQKYGENRRAATSLASESVDSRKHAEFSDIVQQLGK